MLMFALCTMPFLPINPNWSAFSAIRSETVASRNDYDAIK